MTANVDSGLSSREVTEADLRRNPTSRRQLVGRGLSVVAIGLSLVAALPLFSVLYMLITEGGQQLSLEVFTELPPIPMEDGGGIANALVGTLWMVVIASAIAVPFGIFAAIYLAEFGRKSQLAGVIRFTARVLTGMPSILAGVFAFSIVVLTTGTFSAFAGGVALAVLMLPVITLTAEEAIASVPKAMKLAAFGMGCTHTQVVVRVILPAALPGILTGVMLATARAAGETAPLLFTALFNDYMPNFFAAEETASLAVLIYNFSSAPFENQVRMAWTASLVLVSIVLVVNLLGQFLASRSPLARR